jgi:two-component system LytT family response regulator
MLTAIIIDDELSNIRSLANDLTEYCPSIKIIAECPSAKEGIKAIKDLYPELVFLDIEMPWMNGFELLEITDHLDFDVIFTTAYDQYAVKAFRMSAIDYLLKPIDKNDLKQAVEKVIKKRGNFSKMQLHVFKENLNPSRLHQRIGVPTHQGIDFLLINSIVYCEANNNYTFIHLQDNKKVLITKPLKEMEQLLSEYNFCRVHQSFLINLDHLQKYFRGDGGYVKMNNGETINVSRSKKGELLRCIKT